MRDDVYEAGEESFPASDPPANTVETGIGVNGDRLSDPAAEGTETTGTEGTEGTDSKRRNGAAEKNGEERATDGWRSQPSR